MLRKDNWKPRRETFKFWNLVCLILEIFTCLPIQTDPDTAPWVWLPGWPGTPSVEIARTPQRPFNLHALRDFVEQVSEQILQC